MAAITSAVVVAGAAYAGAQKQASASKKAANAQAGAAADANALQQQQYEQTRKDNAPWLAAGNTALQQYMSLLGLDSSGAANAAWDPAAEYLKANPDVANDPSFASDPYGHYQRYGQKEGRTWNETNPNATASIGGQGAQSALATLQATPGYQFALDQGQKSLQSSAAAAGGLYSGKAGKALTEYGQNYATGQFNDYMSKLGNLAGLGQTTASNLGSLGQANTNAQSQNLYSAGQARASGIVGQANAQSNLYSQLGGIAGYAANRWGG